MYLEIQDELKKKADRDKAGLLQRFFKTGPGEYGEGDIFLGVAVPNIRKLAKKYQGIETESVLKLLHSKMHEERLLALLIMIFKFQRGGDKEKKLIYNIYLKNIKYINNWDLVDLSAHKIMGEYLFDKSKDVLYKLVESNNLWERRIAIISCFNFIKRGNYQDGLKIASLLLRDKEDLIHKASGWMLREIGKKDLEAEEAFLNRYCENMPRTMLRYAIEKFPKKKREYYLLGRKAQK